MKIILRFLLPVIIMISAQGVFAQKNEQKDKYGSLGLALLYPQGAYKNNWKTGFHANVTINAKLNKQLYFTAEFPFESVAADSGRKGLAMVGAAPGIKFFPVDFVYLKANAGLHLNLSSNLYSGFATGYLSAGAGIWIAKDFGVFADYALWKAAQGSSFKRFDEYMNVGIMFGFGRKGRGY